MINNLKKVLESYSEPTSCQAKSSSKPLDIKRSVSLPQNP